MQVKGDVSLTWDNDRRVWGANPVIRPEIDDVLGHYVPVGLLQGWWREGFQDTLDKAGGWIVFISRSRRPAGGLHVHVGGEGYLNGSRGIHPRNHLEFNGEV